ncbi:MAG TPA: amidohydrolase family protein [Bryobacteraceae bacterium]|nr:amidohydrolase family protein [Bryobacteraceae bacterium]
MRLENVSIVDGSGAEPFRGNLQVDGGLLVAIERLPNPPATGALLVAPGFIDLHSHSDLQVLEDERREKVLQGVTTEVVGNCGFSPFPQGGHAHELCEFGGGILGKRDGWGWASAADYLKSVESSGGPVRVGALAGHGSLRVAVAGLAQGPLSTAQMDQLDGLLDDSLAAGCVGFSTGLMYAPGSSAGREELEQLCTTVARRGKLYATHMRSYAAGLVDAVREQIALARATGCRLQISHLQAAGRTNWDLQQQALDEIGAARADGVDVEFDIYPYQCGSTVLTQWLPAWSLDGGTEALLARLADAATRLLIRQEMEASKAQQWSDITISATGSSANQYLVGKTLEEAGPLRGVAPVDAALDLLMEEQAAVNVISFNQSEPNLRQLLTHPLCSVISDGFYVNGRPHPRLHGTFPELLGSVVRERGWMGLAEAVHKITGKPAARLGLRDRGLLREGYAADLTIFDPAKIQSRATYESPDLPPEGITAVVKNGAVISGAIGIT